MAQTPSLSIDEGQLQSVVMGRLEVFAKGLVSTISSVAKGLAPVRTGLLRASIHPDPVRRSGPWSLDTGVSADAPYAAPVHQGARPHLIRPRHARFLRFEVEGRTVFARQVRHPGQRAQPFLTNAAHRVVSADPRIDNRGV
jgi:hypothetical protein